MKRGLHLPQRLAQQAFFVVRGNDDRDFQRCKFGGDSASGSIFISAFLLELAHALRSAQDAIII
jgi:hypothetical protein